MATKKHYTKEFKKKVVEEYRNSSFTIEEVATKYGIPPALLQDWVNKDEHDNIFISYVHTPDETKKFGRVLTDLCCQGTCCQGTCTWHQGTRCREISI